MVFFLNFMLYWLSSRSSMRFSIEIKRNSIFRTFRGKMPKVGNRIRAYRTSKPKPKIKYIQNIFLFIRFIVLIRLIFNFEFLFYSFQIGVRAGMAHVYVYACVGLWGYETEMKYNETNWKQNSSSLSLSLCLSKTIQKCWCSRFCCGSAVD